MAIEIGAVVEGEVTGITNFGAFLQLPESASRGKSRTDSYFRGIQCLCKGYS